MNIIKGNIYQGGTGVLVKATENSSNSYFEGVVVEADEHNAYKVDYKSDGWNKTNFKLYSTPLQVEKNILKAKLGVMIKSAFDNNELSSICLENLVNGINQLRNSDF